MYLFDSFPLSFLLYLKKSIHPLSLRVPGIKCTGSLNPSHTAGGQNGPAPWWMSCGEILSQQKNPRMHAGGAQKRGVGWKRGEAAYKPSPRHSKIEKCMQLFWRLPSHWRWASFWRILHVQFFAALSLYFLPTIHIHIHLSIFLTSVLTGSDLEAPANRQACKLLAHVR